jgi:predicted Zn finger-like uncharacterized protein
MIIQCGKCSAKFRFDDALLREEGVWVRCGLCRNEFFQSHPLASPDAAQSRVSIPDAKEIRIDREAEMPDEPPAGNLAEPDIRDDKGAQSSNGASTEKLLKVIIDKKREDKPEKSGSEPQKTAPEKSRAASLARILAALIFSLAVASGVGYYSFPEIGRQVVGDVSAYLPWVEQEKPLSIEEGIRFEAIRQRFVFDAAAGNLRIVEGLAVNQTGHPVARLQVRATLADAQDKRLGEKRAYAGHVLSDAELMVLTEEEINQKLGIPGGSTASNDRIPPGGRIPFMIVWASEPPGAAKTFVTVAGAERLLQ